jgi:hypothetical protein
MPSCGDRPVQNLYRDLSHSLGEIVARSNLVNCISIDRSWVVRVSRKCCFPYTSHYHSIQDLRFLSWRYYKVSK